MDAAFVLVHSPSVGPLTWAPVRQRLDAAGAVTVVPSLAGVAGAGPPFWRPVAATVRQAIDALPPDQPVVLVAHSNAGLFVPVIADASPRPVAGCLFVDAALPAPSGPTPVATADHLDFLRSKVDGGRLPPWTEWWDEADVAAMFPDAGTRAAVSAEQPRLPLSYYEERVPVPAGWDRRPCGYLLFGPPYEPVAEDAARRGWAVRHVPGRHLHQLVDPGTVTTTILAMTRDWRATVQVRLLADVPHLIEPIGRMRFAEWGNGDDVDEWISTTRREAGRDDLPVSWVAVDGTGAALGAVALGSSDVPGRPELAPCVWGMVVRPDSRGRGIGRLLLDRLERFAAGRGHPVVWVLTGPPAVGYYERCGWRRAEELPAGTLLRKPVTASPQ